MKSVFAYNDFRKFLADFYCDRKKRAAYSYREFSKSAEIKAPNFLKLVIDGDKNLTVENIHRFADACKLRQHEHEFFETLVHCGQSRRNSEKDFYKRRILNLRKNHEVHDNTPLLRPLLGNWYLPAVMISLEGQRVSADLSAIAAKCGLSKKAFSDCLEMLERKGLVSHTADGKYQLKYEYANVEDKKAASILQKNYLKKQLLLSQQVFEKAYERNAKFLSHTFTLTKTEFTAIHDRLHALLDEIDKQSSKDAGRDIAQLNLQLFMLDEVQ